MASTRLTLAIYDFARNRFLGFDPYFRAKQLDDKRLKDLMGIILRRTRNERVDQEQLLSEEEEIWNGTRRLRRSSQTALEKF